MSKFKTGILSRGNKIYRGEVPDVLGDIKKDAEKNTFQRILKTRIRSLFTLVGNGVI